MREPNDAGNPLEELFNNLTTFPVAPQYYRMPEPEQEFVKVALHGEKMKFGHKPEAAEQIDVFDLLDAGAGKDLQMREEDKERAREQNLTVIGLDFSLSQSKALYAVQTLLSRTDYKGNMPQRYIKDPSNVFAFTGTLPVLKFTIAEYLDAYGVTKYQSKRGKMEYSSGEREEAIRALRDLEKPVIMVYDRFKGRDKSGAPLYDAIRTVRPLLSIVEGFRDVTESELEGIKAGAGVSEQPTHIVIEPSVVLVDQIGRYFVLKPANLYQELRLKYGKTDKKLALFIEYLLTKGAERARYKEQPSFRLTFETIAYGLRMDALIKSRQQKRIMTQLTDFFQKAYDLGYIASYHFEEASPPLRTIADFSLAPGKVYYPQGLLRGEGPKE